MLQTFSVLNCLVVCLLFYVISGKKNSIRNVILSYHKNIIARIYSPGSVAIRPENPPEPWWRLHLPKKVQPPARPGDETLGSACDRCGEVLAASFPKLTEEEPLENFDLCLPLCLQTLSFSFQAMGSDPGLTVGSLERSQVWLGGALEVYSTPDGVFYICK